MSTLNKFSIVALLGSSAVFFAAESEGAGGPAVGNVGGETVSGAAQVANGATLAAVTDETKITAIKKAMPSRKRHDTLESAIAAMQKADAATDHFYGLPVGIVGYDPDSEEVDASIYEGQNAVLGYVAAKGDEAKGKQSGIKAIVIYPIPTLDAFLADENGKKWLDKVMEKEAGLVVYRNFRDNATLEEFQAGIAKTPKGIAELIAEHTRGGAGLDTETFDATWTGLRLFLKNKQPLLSKALPPKAEVIKCIRSASYAAETQPKLEEAGVFVKLAQTCIGAAANNKDEKTQEAQPLDTSAIESWLANRDTLNLTRATKEDVDVDAAIAQFSDWSK